MALHDLMAEGNYSAAYQAMLGMAQNPAGQVEFAEMEKLATGPIQVRLPMNKSQSSALLRVWRPRSGDRYRKEFAVWPFRKNRISKRQLRVFADFVSKEGLFSIQENSKEFPALQSEEIYYIIFQVRDETPELLQRGLSVDLELSLEVDESGRVISVWGYCPYPAWARSKVTPPHADFLEVFAVSSEQFLRGVSQSVNLDERWPVFVDQQSGWVSLDSGRSATQLAEVLHGAVLGLDDNQQLAALYLRPDRLPQLR